MQFETATAQRSVIFCRNGRGIARCHLLSLTGQAGLYKMLGMDSIFRNSFITRQTAERRSPVWLAPLLAAAVLASLAWCVFSLRASDGRISVTLEDDGQLRHFLVRPCTAEDLIIESKTLIGENDRVEPALDTLLQDGDTIKITRSFPVAVSSEDSVQVLQMTDGTVGEALSLAGVHYDVDDELSALPFADVKPGMRILHTNVEVRYTSNNKTLYYQDLTVKDPSWYTEKKVVEQEGSNGVKLVTQRILTKNGMEVSREVVDQTVIEPAVDRITRVGTKIHYQTGYVGETRLYREKPKAGKNGWVEMTVYRATAYCKGSRTATGTKPKLGTIAVNPDIIPYGSQIWIKGYGYGTAQDTGAFRNYSSPKNNAIDLWFNTEKEAKRWGSKYNMTILVKLK